MGVKGLWTLLGPFCDQKSLYEIRGEKVAIDLSGWICDSQSVTDNHIQPRLYLRNLFFRATYLLMEDITPIFVLEGKAPVAKQTVMANRNQIQYGGYSKKNNAEAPDKKLKKPDTQRKRFAATLTHCENLLKSMGLECVQGIGEAEAMCARLNSTGAVCAVISQDSDCFVYGAVRVYRNFSVSNSGSNSTNSGSVDVYDIHEINKSLNFGRNKMVALALLCGCDYNGNGVDGVGYSNAISFLAQHSDEDIIDRLNSWTTSSSKFEGFLKKLDSNHCTGCGHNGNIRSHTKSGCVSCKTDFGCDQTTYKIYRQNMKIETSIRSKALNNGVKFPDENLINEFLINKEEIPENFRPRWKKPDLIKFVKLMMQSLGWTERYCVEKFLPLITRWQLLNKCKQSNKENISLYSNSKYDKSWLTPLFIKKKRNPKGIPCYEVIWEDPDNYYGDLIPDDQIEGDREEIWTTIERQDLMESAYPDVVEKFLESKKKKSKPKTSKKLNKNQKTITAAIDNLCTVVNNISIDENSKSHNNVKSRKRKMANSDVSYKTKPRKYKRKQEIKPNSSQRRIDSFIKSKNMKTVFDKRDMDTTDALINALDDDETDDNDSDLSIIIDNIITRKNDTNVNKYFKINDANSSTPVKPFAYQKFTEAYNFDGHHCSTPVKNKEKRVSYFFGRINDEDDAFEKSIDLKNAVNIKTNHRKSLIYSEKSFKNITSDKKCNKAIYTPEKKINRNSSLHYTPLLERIRRLKEDL